MDMFDRFQLSALALFYLIFVGRTIQLQAKGTNVFVLGIGKKGSKAILEIFFFFGLAIWTYEVIAHSVHMEFHLLPGVFYFELFDLYWMKVAGVFLTVGGLTIFVLSLVSFGNSWRVGIDNRNPGNLVTTGIFSITRNPIFVFLDLYLLGTWLIYANLFFGMAAALTAIGIHWQILQEEKFLLAQYGERYREYMKAVGRYV